MYEFHSHLIKTDVTSVRIFKSFVLCGVGAYLHLFAIELKTLLKKVKVFEGFKIHGIEITKLGDLALCYGENELKLFAIDWKNLDFKEVATTECSDWILSAKWVNLDNTIVTVTMHNVVEFWSKRLVQQSSHSCEEQCILYCATISTDRWDNIVVYAGTVFSEILYWKPKEEICSVVERLRGHEGVLFSIDHDPLTDYLCSTSDDRSVILWHGNTMAQRIFGHSSRVFGCKLLSDRAISIGEDGIINIWDINGKLVRKIDAHQGGSIWVVDADAERNLMVTGGADSGIIIFPIVPILTQKKIAMPADQPLPKKIILLWNNDVVMIAETGALYHYHSAERCWSLVQMHDELKSYALLEISNCRMQVALAGFQGNMFIYKWVHNKLKLMCSYQLRTKTRIFSLHWLTCKDFLTCGPDGLLYLWRQENSQLLLLHVMQLPLLKERWSTAACVCGEGIAVGDRKGNVYFYNLYLSHPISCIKKAHNYLGITGLYYSDDNLISLGRNSIVRKYRLVDKEKLKLVSSNKLPFSWLALLQKNHQTTILLAFNGPNVVVWDCNKRRILVDLNCGGGHRSWDFNQTKKNIYFVYIKNKHIGIVHCDWDSVYSYSLSDGINVGEINSLKCLQTPDGFLMFAGGEDTTLRVFEYTSSKSRLKQVCVLKSHLSSIRCLHLNTEYDRNVLYSAGGRAQIIMWSATEVCTENFSYYEPISNSDSEVRVMDLCIHHIDNQKVLLAACSNGTVRVYQVEESKIFFMHQLQYDLKCILKVAVLNYQHVPILITMATDGLLVFWKLSLDPCSSVPFQTFTAHQSGINSFSIRKVDTDSYLTLSGGDDNTINLSLYKFKYSEDQLQIELVSSYKNSETHVAQVSGVHLSDGYFITAGLDQKVALFKYNLKNNSIETVYLKAYDTAISDIKGIEVFDDAEKFELVLYGLGIEVLTINKQ